MSAIDIKGRLFERLTVLGRAENNKWGDARWRVRCVCGSKKVVLGYALRSGHSKSCGCLQRQSTLKSLRLAHEAVTKHGHARHGHVSPEFKTWDGMQQRCYWPGCDSYRNYGGRGITVCERWLGARGFENFFADMGPRPEPKHRYSIERINNDGNYEPQNCRWATAKEQAANRRPRVPFRLTQIAA